MTSSLDVAYGGAVGLFEPAGLSSGSFLTVKGCSFRGNTGSLVRNAFGGAISMEAFDPSSLLNVSNCIFERNGANFGGAISVGAATGQLYRAPCFQTTWRRLKEERCGFRPMEQG